MESHPDKNVILRSLGVKPEVDVDVLLLEFILRTVEPEDLSGLLSERTIPLRGIDPILLCDKFIQDVVLEGATEEGGVHPLLFRYRHIHGQQDRRRGIDGHRCRDLIEGNAFEQYFQVFQRIDDHSAFTDFSFGEGVVGVHSPQSR